MTGRFADLKALQNAQEEEAAPATPTPAAATPARRRSEKVTAPARPWEQPGETAEPVKALNGRVPRSVRLEFDRTLIDAVGTLREDVTVDLAVEALVRLLNSDDEVRERWLQTLWDLKHG